MTHRRLMCIALGDGKFARCSCASVAAHNDLHPRESSPTLNLCKIKQFPRARMTQTVSCLGYRLDDQGLEIRLVTETKYFLLHTGRRKEIFYILWFNKYEGFSPALKRSDCAYDLFLQAVSKLRMREFVPSILTWFMARYSVKNREKCIFGVLLGMQEILLTQGNIRSTAYVYGYIMSSFMISKFF
jgi:hypothetical protein